jgi:hypothetical protein
VLSGRPACGQDGLTTIREMPEKEEGPEGPSFWL